MTIDGQRMSCTITPKVDWDAKLEDARSKIIHQKQMEDLSKTVAEKKRILQVKKAYYLGSFRDDQRSR